MRTFQTEFGVFTLDDKRDLKMTNSFINEGSHQRSDIMALRPFLSKEDVVVDVGAHIGTFAIPLSRFSKKVYAIEPMPTTFEFLQRNITDNGIKNITALNYGISEHVDVLYAEELSNRAATFFLDKENGGTKVPARSLDTLVPLDEKIGLIKIDVEGMELEVLKSARGLLDTHRPRIFFEVNATALALHHITRGMLERFLRARGYVFFRPVPGSNPEIPLARIYTLYQGPFFDCLAVPKEKVTFIYMSAIRFIGGQLWRKIGRALRYV
jgi:FkbM family methyltransferase